MSTQSPVRRVVTLPKRVVQPKPQPKPEPKIPVPA
jgi:hypothetical protein